MPTTTCKGCGRITNSATSNWWLTDDFIPTKCFIAWEGNIAVQGCAFNSLITKNARDMWQDAIDKWNKNANKTIEEHLSDLAEGD